MCYNNDNVHISHTMLVRNNMYAPNQTPQQNM